MNDPGKDKYGRPFPHAYVREGTLFPFLWLKTHAAARSTRPPPGEAMSFPLRPAPFFRTATCLAALVLLLSHSLAAAKEKTGEEKTPAVKTAVVLATFGTARDQDGDPLAGVREAVLKRHPGLAVRVAYTSVYVLKSLRAKGKEASSLPQALADLSAEGYTHVAVQSLQVIPGMEYDAVSRTAERFAMLPKGISAVCVGLPLIASHEDAAKLADVLLAALPRERKSADAVVFVGHGAHDALGSLGYPALQCLLRERDPKAFVGTIEGPFDAESVLKAVRNSGARTVWLVPLLTVAGDHAQTDIFGDTGSWKQTFANAGLTVKPVPQGLLALPGVAGMFADHLDAALETLSKEK